MSRRSGLPEIARARRAAHRRPCPDPADDDADAAERRLLAHLLLYHQPRGQAAVVALLRPARQDARSSSSRSATRSGLLVRDSRLAPMPFKRSLATRSRSRRRSSDSSPAGADDPTTGESSQARRRHDDACRPRAREQQTGAGAGGADRRSPTESVGAARGADGELAESVLRRRRRASLPPGRCCAASRRALDARLLGEDGRRR